MKKDSTVNLYLNVVYRTFAGKPHRVSIWPKLGPMQAHSTINLRENVAYRAFERVDFSGKEVKRVKIPRNSGDKKKRGRKGYVIRRSFSDDNLLR